MVGFNATALIRFSVVVAFYTFNEWRFGYRIVVTFRNGILVIPIFNRPLENRDGSYHFPDEFQFNTALILGINLIEAASIANLEIFANGDGFFNDNDDDIEYVLNGYAATVKWDVYLVNITLMDDTIKMEAFQNQLRFHHKLYRISMPLETHITDQQYINKEYHNEIEDETDN